MIKLKKRITSGYITESFTDRAHLSKSVQKSLVKRVKKHSGRDCTGKLSVRHRGGGAKKKYRIISTLDQFPGVEAKVLEFHYDPNRTAHLALIGLIDGRKRYIIAPDGLKVGDVIQSDPKRNLRIGDRSQLKNIIVGTQIHDIEVYPKSPSRFARSAGSYATVLAHDNNYALLKLPSGELRKVHENCYASIGQVSNVEQKNIQLGKAGRVRHLGIRPTVRGKAMHPAAHPHGGGEGVNPIGLKYPKTPWGKVAIGKKTRRNKKTDKFIVRRRVKKR